MPICAKNKPRKVFNAAKQRAEGTDIVIPKKKQQAKVGAKKKKKMVNVFSALPKFALWCWFIL